MNPYLRASIICFAIVGAVLAVMLIEACQHYTVTGVCRHEATYNWSYKHASFNPNAASFTATITA